MPLVTVYVISKIMEDDYKPHPVLDEKESFTRCQRLFNKYFPKAGNLFVDVSLDFVKKQTGGEWNDPIPPTEDGIIIYRGVNHRYPQPRMYFAIEINAQDLAEVKGEGYSVARNKIVSIKWATAPSSDDKQIPFSLEHTIKYLAILYAHKNSIEKACEHYLAHNRGIGLAHKDFVASISKDLNKLSLQKIYAQFEEQRLAQLHTAMKNNKLGEVITSQFAGLAAAVREYLQPLLQSSLDADEDEKATATAVKVLATARHVKSPVTGPLPPPDVPLLPSAATAAAPAPPMLSALS